MTTDELIADMSIAGNPEKFRGMLNKIWPIVFETVDHKNVPDFINAKMVMQKIITELEREAKKLAKDVHGIPNYKI